MSLQSLTILSGVDKSGSEETIRKIDIYSGEVVGIVGATGSGKSTLISDIEQLAQADTSTQRQILINGKAPEKNILTHPRKKRIAQLSQNMHFLTDLTVWEFLRMHAKSRGRDVSLVEETIRIANTLVGEPIYADSQLTVLSGGQSRALMAADIAIISDSPIVLIDEIENAGIKKHEALKLLAAEGKIVLVVTHDPVLALMTQRRIVMRNGGMAQAITTTANEKAVCSQLVKVDNYMISLRNTIRSGGLVEEVCIP